MRAVNWNKKEDDFSLMFWKQNIAQFWTEEEINKYVGICIGLVVRLNQQLIDRYIQLVNENNGFKKSALLNGIKEVFKSKQEIPNQIGRGTRLNSSHIATSRMPSSA